MNNYKKHRNKLREYNQYTFLNTAGFGPIRRLSYLQQLWYLLKQSSKAIPTTAAAFDLINEKELGVKSKMSSFFDCDREDILLNQGITESIYFALQNIPDLQDAEIVIPEYEFSSLLIALQYYKERYNLKITVVPLEQSRERFIDSFKAAITEKTALVMMSHVNYLFGKILPVKEIVEHASELKVPVFVDGAQAAGAVSFSLRDLRPSYYAGTFVKWLHGPLGHGFLYIDQNQQKNIVNHSPGRRACKNHASIFSLADEPEYQERAWKSQLSTYNYNNLFLLDLCLKNQLDRDIEKRVKYVSELRTMLVKLLKTKPGLFVYDDNDWEYSGIVTIGSEKDLTSLNEYLLSKNIIAKYFQKPNLLRFSLSYLNNRDDVYWVCNVIEIRN